MLKKKRDERGRLIKYKARLNAQGFTQVEGLDYDETYAAVVRTDTIRLLLAHAYQNHLHMAQYDIESAYLNAELEEEIYLKPSPGVTVTAGKVLRLRKSIYGLKQAARAWADLLKVILAKRGLHRASADPALYVNRKSGEFVAVHVDDLLYVSRSKTDFKEWLGGQLTINALGRPKYLLSIELDWGVTSLTLHQSAYISRIVDKFLPTGEQPTSAPMSPSERPMPRGETELKADLKMYQSAIGSLLYAAVISRPDILFAVCQLSQFLGDPSEDHWRMAINVFRYLAGTRDRKLTYKTDPSGAGNHPLRVYSDTSYANNLPDRRSYSGVVAFYQGCLVAWSSTKQSSVILSTTEAEYIALTTAVQSLSWLECLQRDLGVLAGGRPTLLGDNVSSHFLVRNPSFHCRSKHIDVRYHFIRERHEAGVFTLEFVNGKENPADALTKALAAEKLSLFISLVFS